MNMDRLQKEIMLSRFENAAMNTSILAIILASNGVEDSYIKAREAISESLEMAHEKYQSAMRK